MSSDDLQLIQECLEGNTGAFGHLVDRYSTRLYNTLFRVLGSSHDAHDVAQEAFVLAFQKLNSFRGDSAFYSWLFRIAMNVAASHRRKKRLKSVSVESVREQAGVELEDHHPAARPAHQMELAERQALVQTALSELSEEFRTPLMLKELEGLPYEEIAKLVGCPVGTVRSRIHRARSELREKLARLLRDD